MKSWLTYSLRIALTVVVATLFTTACVQSDFDEPLLAGDTAKVSFNLGLDDQIVTRVGEGSNIDKLLVAVYENNTLVTSKIQDVSISNGYIISGNLDFELLIGQTYKAVFFAYHDGAYSFEDDYKKISIATYDTDPENVDAFHKCVEFTVTSQTTIKETLYRPFGLMVFGAKNENYKEGATATVALSGIATSFNSIAGTIGTTGEQTLSFTPNGTKVPGNDNYTLLGMVYVLPGENITPTLTLSVNGVAQDSKVLKTIKVEANKRYNFLGNSLFVDNSWGGEINLTALPAENVDSDGWIHIRTEEELAYLLTKGDDAEVENNSQMMTRADEPIKYHICKNMNMEQWKTQTTTATFTNTIIDAGQWSNDVVKIGSCDAGSYTITGLKMNANGMFATVSEFAAQNMVVAGCTMTSTTNTGTGMVVGQATGSLTLTNITVSDTGKVISFVQGVSKVGGLVGYINSSTNSTATITNCSSNAEVNTTTTEEGPKYAGALVGCFRGYDDTESLTFIDCSQGSESNFTTPFCTAEQACFNVEDLELVDDEEHLLGGEEHCRGTIKFGYTDVDNIVSARFFYRWDGTRTIKPIFDGKESDKKVFIYSPYDLAYCQSNSYTSITFFNDVDMGGTDDELKLDGNTIRTTVNVDFARPFKPISSVKNLTGNGKTIHHLRVQMIHDGSGAGLIQNITGGEVKDLTIDKAYIFNDNNWSKTLPVYPTVDADVNTAGGKSYDNGQGNAYAGTLATTVSNTATVSNVHITNGKVFAICKIGGLIGRLTGSSGTAKIENCSVDKCTIENYKANVPNYYALLTEKGGMPINLLQWWYTQGEVGGLIGFVQHIKADINSCSVTNTNINCFGQPDKIVTANVWNSSSFNQNNHYVNNKSILGRGNTTIAGRHVNQFIGEVVSQRTEARASSEDYTVTIKDYVVSNNNYGHDSNTHMYASDKYCDIVGSAYYVGVDVNILGIEEHMQFCAGKLIFNKKGETTPITLTETIKNGNNKDWMGGSFTDIQITIILWSPKSSFPSAPATIGPEIPSKTANN